jgi:CRP-like cAMP-binding protein
MIVYVAHLGYLISLCAFLVRDVLILRSLLVAAQVLVSSYALANHLVPVALWNLLFLCVNLTWIAIILRERRATALPAELQPVYERRFTALTPREFLRWWRLGRRETLDGIQLATAGEHPEWLSYLLGGEVRVSRGATRVTEVPAGFFIGEMSLITGHPANADVRANGAIDVIRWPFQEVRAMRHRTPDLWTKIQSVIGHDLVEKITRGDERLAGHDHVSEMPKKV